MGNSKKPDQVAKDEATQSVDPRIDLAIDNTSLALERTQLAWVRTAITFITAGFAIDKATAFLQEARIAAGVALSNTGHFGGLLLTGFATALMIIVTVTYMRRVVELNRMRVLKGRASAPTTILSIFVCVIGGIMIFALSNRW
jgi:putative membrane protein